MAFDRNVFVNCPFDDDYRAILESILFTISYLGFEPRIALESRDSGQTRIEKILALIRESKYSVHDLSRIRASSAGEYFRLNMPFELGLDFGCRAYGGRKWQRKRCLILEAECYRYQIALSDLAGSDIQVHRNNPQLASREVRDWLGSYPTTPTVGSDEIWLEFNSFMRDTSRQLRERGYSKEDIKRLGVGELKRRMREWAHKKRRKSKRCARRSGHVSNVAAARREQGSPSKVSRRLAS